MEIYVVDLVRDFNTHKVIGADIYLGSTRKRVSIKELAVLLSTKQYKLSNAVFTKDGVLRGKPGVSLPSVVLNTAPNTIEQRDIAQAKKIKTVNKLTVYHGSKEKVLVPQFGIGKKNNDYGQGFYTTPNKELAKEWAYAGYTSGAVGYVHTFKDIDISGLNVLDFTEMDSMHWLAELLAYRKVNGTSGITAEVLGSRIQAVLDNFKINTKNVDIMVGYRADDSYFTVAEAFVLGTLYKEAMELAFRRGDLGLQVFFKSSRAFERLRQSQHSIELVDKKYKARFDRRDDDARLNAGILRNLNTQVRTKENIVKVFRNYGLEID